MEGGRERARAVRRDRWKGVLDSVGKEVVGRGCGGEEMWIKGVEVSGTTFEAQGRCLKERVFFL